MLRQLLLSEPELRVDEGPPATPGAFVLLAEEFPTVRVRPLAQADGAHVLHLDAQQWRAPGFDPFDWDEHVFGAADACAGGELALYLSGAPREALAATALEVLTRYQGLIGRRNAASEGPLFDTLLARHRSLHDVSKPLVLADLRHALDSWQWLLRLAPGADLALQAAALLHDVERLSSEAEARVEHRAADYQAFKKAHAVRGADVAAELLAELGVEPATRERVRWLIGHHEHPEGDTELQLLNDADALSFFSLNASGFARYFPLEHTRRKVDYTLSRLRTGQRWRLARVRLAPQVRRLLEEALGAVPPPMTLQETA